MSNTSKLVLIRHGETDWNVERRFQGQIDVPLNEMGRQQARDVAKDLCAMQAKALRTSPLSRAFETAKIIGDMCGLPPVVDDDLKEIDVGHWGGLLDPEVAEQFPEEHEAWTAGEDIARGGGETYREAGKRGADAIEKIVASFEEDSLLLIVSHGIVLRESIAHLMSRRVIASASEAKHLGNAEWIEFTIIR